MMKKFFTWAMMLAGIMLGSCTSSDDVSDSQQGLGSIYGIVTELGTAEPMKAIGVELYKFTATSTYNGKRFYTEKALLLKTVTFDDGHFEFQNLSPRDYVLQIVADGYEQENEGYVNVGAGRQARIDLQVKKVNTYISVYTEEAVISGNSVTLRGNIQNKTGYNTSLYPSEVGFIYSTHSNPKDEGIQIKGETEFQFSAVLNGLVKGSYYYQAYAKNSYGTEYGEIRSFEITGSPVVTTLPPTNITQKTATLNGRIEFEGEPAYTERGFVYSETFSLPTVDDPANATTKVAISGRNKEFAANISSLTENVRYYVRAYAMYEGGTVYGDVLMFKPEHPDYIVLDNLMIQKQDLGKTGWGSAIEMCESSRIAGFSDWHLPTLAELSFIYQHKEEIPNLTEYRYWSATQGNNVRYAIDFSNGTQFSVSYFNSTDFYVRAVRSIK